MSNNYFILTCRPIETTDGKIKAYDVAKYNIYEQKWPIFEGTRNRRKIKQDDKFLLYLVGKMYVIGEIVANDKVIKSRFEYPTDWLVSSFSYCFPIKTFFEFTNPIRIKPLVQNLSFIPDPNNWGFRLQGGCIRIPMEDYNFIYNSYN